MTVMSCICQMNLIQAVTQIPFHGIIICQINLQILSDETRMQFNKTQMIVNFILNSMRFRLA